MTIPGTSRATVLIMLGACGRIGFDGSSSIADAAADAVTACTPQPHECSCWTSAPTNIDPCMSCAPATFAPLDLVVAGQYDFDTDAGVLLAPTRATAARDTAIQTPT